MKSDIMRKAILTLLLSGHVAVMLAGKIVYPGGACPAIIKRGETLEILYKNPAKPAIDSVILRGPYNRVAMKVVKIEKGKFEYDNYTQLATDHRITVRIPDGTPEELYDLIVKTSSSVCISPKSVKVVKEFSKRHTIIHITDPHVTRMWVQTEHGSYGKELELLDKFISVANIIAPDFIMVTGDIIHDYTRLDADSIEWGGYLLDKADEGPLIEEKFKNYFEGACGYSGVWGFNAPVFSTTGNHDFYGVNNEDYIGRCSQWNKFAGKRVYGFSYNTTRVIVTDDFNGDHVLDSPVDAPMSGLQGKTIRKFLEKEGRGECILWGKHSYNHIDTAFMNDNKVKIILHGHKHTPGEQYIGTTPTLNISPGVVCRSGNIALWKKTLGFFRVFTIEGDKFDYTRALRFCTNPTAPYDKLNLNLTLDYDQANNARAEKNRAVIRNKFDIGFKGCRVRFVMPKGLYEVTNGTIRQTIETDKLSVVDVDFDVKANGLTVVEIFPAKKEKK